MALTKSKIIEIISGYCSDISAETSIDTVDKSFIKENDTTVLRILIDKRGGVSMDECENFSNLLIEKLNVNDPIDFPYCLEVASPGIDRPLKTIEDIKRHIGEEVEVKLRKEYDKKTKLQGILETNNDDNITIKINDIAVVVRHEDIKSIKRVVKF